MRSFKKASESGHLSPNRFNGSQSRMNKGEIWSLTAKITKNDVLVVFDLLDD